MNPPDATERQPWQSVEKLIGPWFGVLQVVANLTGAFTVTIYFLFFDNEIPFQNISQYLWVIVIMCVGLFFIGFSLQYRWERDLDRFTRLKRSGRKTDAALTARAQRKILEMPYVCALIDLFNWFLASLVMSGYRLIAPQTADNSAATLIEAGRVFIGVLISGILTSAIIFFTVEVATRRVRPLFFPEGGLMRVRSSFRLRLGPRMFLIFGLTSVIPLVLMAVLSYNKARLMLEMQPAVVIQSLLYLTSFLLLVTLAIAVILSRLFTTSIVSPIERMEKAMARVAGGDFSATVTVETNDELGALGEHFNQMTEGLQERYRMQRALDLAKEVQQHLLPSHDPLVQGLDIAGKSIYCDETGGDYFDFISSHDIGDQKLGIVIGDVSEHGIPSALLMATTRAFLRQRSSLPGSLSEIVTDVNQQLTRDVRDTGRFVTLFYLMLDLRERSLQWVRAGHEPAILYDPGNDTFAELGGEGIALGVDKNWHYKAYEHRELGEGQIILLSTDGVWESLNPQGRMFGKDPVFRILRESAGATAGELLDTIILELNHFRRGRERLDDITLAIVKSNFA